MIARSPLLPILSMLLLVAAAPAAATEVNVKYADADYESWKTFSFIVTAQQKKAQDNAGRTDVRAAVRSELAEQLQKAGFEPAGEGEAPDFRVAIDGTMREVFDVRDYHQKIADHVALVMEGGTTSYHEGTLMIRILEGDEDKVVWTGWITDKIEDPEVPERRIRRAVKKILREFPPRER